MSEHAGALFTSSDDCLYWSGCLCGWKSEKYVTVGDASADLSEHLGMEVGDDAFPQ